MQLVNIILASKASIVLFDGSPMYKSKDLLLKIAEKEKITLLGVSAKYIDALRKYRPNLKIKLSQKLKTIAQLAHHCLLMDLNMFIEILKNVHLASISGGTDIISCFVLGNLYEPVNLGEIQNNGLALDVDIFDNNGYPVKIRANLSVKILPFNAYKILKDNGILSIKMLILNVLKIYGIMVIMPRLKRQADLLFMVGQIQL